MLKRMIGMTVVLGITGASGAIYSVRLLEVLIAAVVVFALLLRSDRLARAIGRGLGRVVDAARRSLAWA